MTPMKYNRLSVGIMFAGFVIWLVGMFFIENIMVLSVSLIATFICIIVSIIIHTKYARCENCGKHLTRIWGDTCPHCKNKIN